MLGNSGALIFEDAIKLLSSFTKVLFPREGNTPLYRGCDAIVDEPESNIGVAGIFLCQRAYGLGGALMGCNNRADGNRASFDTGAVEYSFERLLDGTISINDLDVLAGVERSLYQPFGMFRIAQGGVHHEMTGEASGGLANTVASGGEDYFAYVRVCQRAGEKLVAHPLGRLVHGWAKPRAGGKGCGVFREQLCGIIGVEHVAEPPLIFLEQALGVVLNKAQGIRAHLGWLRAALGGSCAMGAGRLVFRHFFFRLNGHQHSLFT